MATASRLRARRIHSQAPQTAQIGAVCATCFLPVQALIAAVSIETSVATSVATSTTASRHTWLCATTPPSPDSHYVTCAKRCELVIIVISTNTTNIVFFSFLSE